MFIRDEISDPTNPFADVYSYIRDHAIALEFLIPELIKLERRLVADCRGGHIEATNLREIKRRLQNVMEAANQFDVNGVNDNIDEIKKECTYRRTFRSKWSLIGAAIGAAVYMGIYVGISVISSGTLTLPLTSWVVNAVSGSVVGVWFGHKIGQWRARREISSVGNSINSFFKRAGMNPRIPNKTPQQFAENMSLKPESIFEVGAKLAAIYYQDLIITQDNIKTVLSEYLMTTKQKPSALNAEFVDKLLKISLDKSKFTVKTLLASVTDLTDVVASLQRPQSAPRLQLAVSM